MKILWLSHRDPQNPSAGGVERTIYEVCSRLSEKGYTIILLTGGWKGCKPTETIRGIEIHRVGINIGPHVAAPIFIAKNKFDLIVNDLGHAIPWFSPILMRKKNTAFFHHLHARSLDGQVSPLLSKIIKSIERCYFIIYRGTTFVTESHTSESDLLNLGIKYEKIVKIPPGVDRKIFHPAEKTQYPTIVYFGGMRKYKRPQEVLFLLKKLVDMFTNIKLFMIGYGQEIRNIKHLVNELHLQNFVELKGRITNEQLSHIVAASWLNVHTAVTEGWGFSVLEASSAGTPTVAYDVPGIRDSIENGLNGLKVSDGDREALLKAAFSILANPEKWWTSSVEVAKKYSWDRTTELWEDIINKVVNE